MQALRTTKLRSVRLLILAHVCISLGGLLIHIKLHPMSQSLYFWWASPVAAFSVLVLPLLFSRSSTVGWAYMLNAATVAIGTLGMAYFSLLKAEGPLPLSLIFVDSTLPNILILLAKLPIAHLILLQMRPQGLPKRERGCRE